MQIVYLILLIVACVCFAIAAFAPERSGRVNMLGLGLLAFALVPTIQMVVRIA
jgi:hypothetical protein